MSIIQFENGVKVQFEGTPTEADIEEVFQSIQKQGKLGQTPKVVDERKQADIKSAEKYGAWFPAEVGKDIPIVAGAKAAGNIIPSAYGLGKSVLGMATQPIKTMQGLGTLLAGGVEKLIPGTQQDEAMFNQFTQAMKERYGSLDNLQRTATNDPFAFGTEIYGLLTGGAALAGKQKQLSQATSMAAKPVTVPAKAVGQIPGRVAGKVSDVITPIDPGVEKILIQQANPAKLKSYTNQAKIALADYSKETPLALAGDKAQKTLAILNGKLKTIGTQKRVITQSIANQNTGSIVKNSIDDLRNLLQERTGTSIIQKEGGGISVHSTTGRVSTISSMEDKRMLAEVYSKLMRVQKNPTFQQVDDVIDYVQDVLYKRSANTAVPINTQVQGILKGVTRKLNDGLKQVGGKKYIQSNDAYSAVRGVRDELAKSLGVEAKKGASLMKTLFSPSGEGTRRLFENVKRYTGVDLVEEATLAKFAMEKVGDARQASLLEEAIMGRVVEGGSFVQKAAEAVIRRLQNPIKKAEKIIQKANK